MYLFTKIHDQQNSSWVWTAEVYSHFRGNTQIHYSLARAIDTQQKLVFCGFHFSQTEANILPYHTTALTKEAY